MEQLPPPPVPLRPDLAPVEIEVPGRRRFPLWVTVVCALLAISMGVVAIAPVFEGAEEPRGPGYLFLDRTDQGTPTRWDPCEPIHYVVNAELAPPGSVEDVHEAVRRVSGATRIAFVYEGPTDEEVSRRGPVRSLRRSMGAGPHRMGGSRRLGHPVRTG